MILFVLYAIKCRLVVVDCGYDKGCWETLGPVCMRIVCVCFSGGRRCLCAVAGAGNVFVAARGHCSQSRYGRYVLYEGQCNVIVHGSWHVDVRNTSREQCAKQVGCVRVFWGMMILKTSSGYDNLGGSFVYIRHHQWS